MSTGSINVKKIIEPDLTSYIQDRKYDIKTEMNCVGVGTVQAFNTVDQTVTVSLNYLRVIKGGLAQNAGATDLTTDRVLTPQQMPQLIKCPFVFPQGGVGYLTMPVVKGDECVVLFNDRDIDNWWSTGGVSAPNTDRVHDMSDAMVFVGVRSLARSLKSYNVNGPEMGNLTSTAKVACENLVKISVNNVTLMTALNMLLSALETWVNTDSTTPNPATVAAIQAAQTALQGILK